MLLNVNQTVESSFLKSARDHRDTNDVGRRSRAILAARLAGILAAEKMCSPGETPGCPTGKMPVLR